MKIHYHLEEVLTPEGARDPHALFFWHIEPKTVFCCTDLEILVKNGEKGWGQGIGFKVLHPKDSPRPVLFLPFQSTDDRAISCCPFCGTKVEFVLFNKVLLKPVWRQEIREVADYEVVSRLPEVGKCPKLKRKRSSN